MFVVGIAGGSASGKSTVAHALDDALGEQSVLVSHDDYYRTLPDRFRADTSAYNFDHPDALESSRLVEDIASLRAGQSVEVVQYDFVTCSRRPSSAWKALQPANVLIVEGILVLSVPALASVFDLSVFVDAPADVRLGRRVVRDIAERGHTAAAVVKQYFRTVRPMHNRFVEPCKTAADLVLNGEQGVGSLVHAIRARLP